MNRDLLIQHMVGLEAQLRRIQRLSGKIGSAEELNSRIPPLIDAAARSLASLNNQIRQMEGG